VDSDRPSWTIDEAVAWLDPAVTRRQLSTLISTLGVKPVGQAPSTGGRPANLYDTAEIMRLHAGVVEWLAPRSG
jgi:hypothetical protein